MLPERGLEGGDLRETSLKVYGDLSQDLGVLTKRRLLAHTLNAAIDLTGGACHLEILVLRIQRENFKDFGEKKVSRGSVGKKGWEQDFFSGRRIVIFCQVQRASGIGGSKGGGRGLGGGIVRGKKTKSAHIQLRDGPRTPKKKSKPAPRRSPMLRRRH